MVPPPAPAPKRYQFAGYTAYLEHINSVYNQGNNDKGTFNWLNYQRGVWAHFRHTYVLETYDTNLKSFIDIWSGYCRRQKIKASHNLFRQQLINYAADKSLTTEQLVLDQSSWGELPPIESRDEADRRVTSGALVRWYEQLVQPHVYKTYTMKPEYENNLQREIQQLLKLPNTTAVGHQSTRNILLYSKPGGGKSSLVNALCSNVHLRIMSLSSSSWNSKLVGDSEANINAFILASRLFSPFIVFMDECDGILDENSSTEEHSKNEQILIQRHLSGDGDPTPGMIVFAATNYVSRIKPAMRSRFGNTIKISLPPEKDLLEIAYSQLEKNGYVDVRNNTSIVDQMYRKVRADDMRQINNWLEKARTGLSTAQDNDTLNGEQRASLASLSHSSCVLRPITDYFLQSIRDFQDHLADELDNPGDDGNASSLVGKFEIDGHAPRILGAVYIHSRDDEERFAFLVNQNAVAVRKAWSESERVSMNTSTVPEYTPFTSCHLVCLFVCLFY